MAVHDALRQPRGPRRVDDPERVVEGQRRVLRLPLVRDGVRPGQGAVRQVVREEPRDGDRRPHGRQGGAELGDDVPAVVVLAVEPVAVDGDQHGGLDLDEPVEHRAGAEVGRAGGPHRAHRRRAQERDDRLGHVGQVAGHAIAGPHAEPPQRRGEGADLPAQRRPGDVDRVAVLGDGHERRALVGRPPQRLLGEVHRRPGEPLGPRHLAPGEDPVVGDARQHAGPLGDVGPELVEVLDRPAPHRVVVGRVPEGQATLLGHPGGELREAGLPDALGGRAPQDLGRDRFGGHADSSLRSSVACPRRCCASGELASSLTPAPCHPGAAPATVPIPCRPRSIRAARARRRAQRPGRPAASRAASTR